MKKNDVITDINPEMLELIVCSIKLSFDEMFLFVELCLEDKIMVFDVATLQYLETTTRENHYRVYNYSKYLAKIDPTTLVPNDSESGQVVKTFKKSKFIITPSDKCYKIWNIRTGKYVSSINFPWEDVPVQFVISENEKYVFARGNSLILHYPTYIYDIKTGKLIKELDDSFEFKQDFISLSENRLIVLYSNYAKFWDVENGECIKSIELYNKDEAEYSSVTVTKDEKYLISWHYMDESNISYIRFWDISSGQCVKVLSTSGDYIKSVVVHSDYKSIFSLQPNCIKKWDTETCEVVGEINFPLIK